MGEVILKNLTKVFEKEVIAVKNVDLTIADKEFMILVGPSGCGKSTTLRMVAGLEDISEGQIYIDGKLVNNIPPKDRDIAMVFQNYALYPHMTVFENMAFALKLRKYKKDEIKRRVAEAAEILGLVDLLDRKPKELSGGQRQRVAVGRAIVRKPRVFLFDEPLSNLDAKLRVQMRIEIIKLHQQLQTTIIYVTHDQVEAMTMGNRITVMKDGIVHQVDTPMNLYRKPKDQFVASFIGSPAMNFFSGELVKNGQIKFKNVAFDLPIPQKYQQQITDQTGKKVMIGIRPEDFSLQQLSHLNQSPIQSKVEVIEPMGNEIYVYLNTQGQNFVARMEPLKQPTISEQVTIYINIDNIHLFNQATNQSMLV